MGRLGPPPPRVPRTRRRRGLEGVRRRDRRLRPVDGGRRRRRLRRHHRGARDRRAARSTWSRPKASPTTTAACTSTSTAARGSWAAAICASAPPSWRPSRSPRTCGRSTTGCRRTIRSPRRSTTAWRPTARCWRSAARGDHRGWRVGGWEPGRRVGAAGARRRAAAPSRPSSCTPAPSTSRTAATAGTPTRTRSPARRLVVAGLQLYAGGHDTRRPVHLAAVRRPRGVPADDPPHRHARHAAVGQRPHAPRTAGRRRRGRAARVGGGGPRRLPRHGTRRRRTCRRDPALRRAPLGAATATIDSATAATSKGT